MTTRAEIEKEVSSDRSEDGLTDAELADLAGKYIIFHLGDEEYGIDILKVREIIEMMDVTPIPRTPDSVRGVINLRGKVIPVVEVRQKFGLEAVEDTHKTCIIVVQVNRGEEQYKMGLIVDEVTEVMDIESEDIQRAPDFGDGIDDNFIRAISKCNSEVQVLLNVEEVVLDEDYAESSNELHSSS
jgi:purine-binding chemotaxis protein CheW